MERFIEIGLGNALMAAVLAVIAGVVALVCRRPALVHALWLLVLIKLVTPPLVPIGFHLGRSADSPPAERAEQREPAAGEEPHPEAVPDKEEPAPALQAEVAAEEEPPAAAEPVAEAALIGEESAEAPASWRPLLVGLWLAGSALWFALAIRRVWRFARALGYARRATGELQARVAGLARQIGLSRCPEVLLLPGRLAPLVWGLGRPRLLLPEGLPARLGEEELDTILLHELAHIRRRDHLVRWLEFLALGLFWWNPVAWYARRELREAEEQCCDAWVVRTLPGTGRTYATALIDALDFLCSAPAPLPPLASGLGKMADLKRRLTMILRGTTPHALGRSSRVVVACLALLLLFVPGIAQTQEPEKREVRVTGRLVAAQVPDGDLKKIQAEIEKKAAELAELKKKMDQLKMAQLRAREKEVYALRIAEAQRARDTAKAGPVIRIEISGLNVSADELKKLAEALEKTLPGKRRVLILNPGQGGGAYGVRVVPKPLAPPTGPGAPLIRAVTAPPGDKRIDGLEKKLDALLHELEALRKEIHGSRGRGNQGGSTPEVPRGR